MLSQHHVQLALEHHVQLALEQAPVHPGVVPAGPGWHRPRDTQQAQARRRQGGPCSLPGLHTNTPRQDAGRTACSPCCACPALAGPKCSAEEFRSAEDFEV